MKPERQSKRVDSITHARARMFEFNVPEGLTNLDAPGINPADLLPLVIGILGDEAARVAALTLDPESPAGRITPNDSSSLRFAAGFMHAYVSSRDGESLAPELLLLSAAAYYVGDLAGSSSVLVREAIRSGQASDYWETFLRWLLTAQLPSLPLPSDSQFAQLCNTLGEALLAYFADGSRHLDVVHVGTSLRQAAYLSGSPRDLLYSDLIVAVSRKRLGNAARSVLPAYSGLTPETWVPVFAKPSFMRELWPSQHVFGERGVLQGRSAVIQMPTSAGKTRGVELVIRSAFYSDRAKLVVVVAPFRALCTEITGALRAAFKDEQVQLNQLSDALLVDYSALLSDLFGDSVNFDLVETTHNQVVVLTPEKLLYVLRHNPELVDAMGSVIYDEGHQFDSDERGVTYELLLTSIKRLLPRDKQIVLISAVITNAEAIGRWLIGEDAVVVDGKDLSTTRRSVAFASWQLPLGQLRFVAPHDADHVDYFVPRLIEQRTLPLLPRERTVRVFPERNANSVALYLGLQVVRNGSVAVFCGRKATAGSIATAAVDAFRRGLEMTRPSQYCDPTELGALGDLHSAHFGEEESVTQAARLGIFSHHGNTPQGIRLCVEHAMKMGLVKFVICTSTLAQGVNLPIRYLIITGTMQGADRIKTRDFHNLIGRAGRAGMYTEGTVIFSDPNLYDSRLTADNQRKWEDATKLLNPDSAESTESSLLALVAPFRNLWRDRILTVDMNGLLRQLLRDSATVGDALATAAQKYSRSGYTEDDLKHQLRRKIRLLEALQSYLMANRGDAPFEEFLVSVEQLARDTLAHALGNEEQRTQLITLFQDVATHINTHQPDTQLQAAYGKTLLGLVQVERIREWLIQNPERFIEEEVTEDQLLSEIWPLLVELLEETQLNKFLPNELALTIATRWINGDSYLQLLMAWIQGGGRIRHGDEKTRRSTLNDIVGLCENTFAFDVPLIVAAVSEILTIQLGSSESAAHATLARLVKRLRYGLTTADEIALYELGFADRVVARQLAATLTPDPNLSVRARLRENPAAQLVFDALPQYFQHCFEGIR